MALPYPGMDFVPYDILTAEELDQIVANIASLADGSGFNDNAVTSPKILDGAVTSSKVATGMPVQMAATSFNAVATGTTQIPFDNTIPQNTEGTEFMTLSFTPKSASSTLVIDVKCLLSTDTASRNLIAALFKDSDANALAAGGEFTDDAAALIPRMITFTHKMTSGTTSPITFKVRGGANNTGTVTFNGFSGGGVFGATSKSSIVVTEVKV